MVGIAVSLAWSTPSVMLYGKLPEVPPTPGWKPSSPTDTMWLASRLLMNVDISVAQPTSVSAVQVPDAGSEALMQRGSLPNSHEKIAGSFLYCTPVIVLVRLTSAVIQSL